MNFRSLLKLNPRDGNALTCLVKLALINGDIPLARKYIDDLMLRESVNSALRGRSTKVSQTHFGSLLDEFSLEVSGLARVKGFVESAPSHVECRDLALEFPDYTPAALAALVSMRLQGEFERFSANSGNRIPSEIVQYWNEEPPGEIRSYMRSWQLQNVGWTHTVYDEHSAHKFLREIYGDLPATAFKRARSHAQKSDIFRLGYLAAKGGVWADADDRCLVPVGPTIAGKELVLYQEDYGTVGNNFIACVARHPLLLKCFTAACQAILRGDVDSVWLATGPGLLTRKLAVWLLQKHNEDWQQQAMAILSKSQIQKTVAFHCFASYKRTDSHWCPPSAPMAQI